MTFSINAINVIVTEYGPPIRLETDDGESVYWRFEDNEDLAADDLGSLFVAASRVLPKEYLEQPIK